MEHDDLFHNSPVQKDRFAKHVGVRLIAVGRGYAEASVELAGHHLNGVGIAHGAVLFTLADVAFAAAANSYENIAVAATIHISFFQAVSAGRLMARANEVSRSRKLATYQIDVTNEAGDRIASMQGTAYRKSPTYQTSHA